MTKFTRIKKIILCMTLAVTTALLASGCGGADSAPVPTAASVQTQGEVIGEGSARFDLTVADMDGNETRFEVHTDKETVGEALTELGLIEGEEGAYGLYVKTVNGISADYDKDGVYWAFYIDGEYANTGIDSTPVTEGASYSLRIEK